MKRSLIALALAIGFGSQAHAAVVPYFGANDAVSSLSQMTNALTSQSAYNAAVTGGSVIDFEGALPSGVSIAGGSVTSNSGCGALCGFNTTSGGRNFLYLYGGSTTFTFSAPIQAFAFFITGLQTNLVSQQTLTFSDGSSQSLNIGSAVNGGGAFFGFTDFGKSITSVTFNATNDIVAIDDVRFGGTGGVPEPATWAMMISGFGLAGAALRRRRTVVAA